MEPPKTSTCPICKKPSVVNYHPFCSKRCADIDLAHWLRGDYSIEGRDESLEEKKEPEPIDEED